jgi:hypothetical protein
VESHPQRPAGTPPQTPLSSAPSQDAQIPGTPLPDTQLPDPSFPTAPSAPTLNEWLAAREQDVPDELKTHIRAAVHGALQQPLGSGGVDALVQAARGRLSVLLDSDPASRNTAIDLLTVDALLTYALEAIASQRVNLNERVVAMLGDITSIELPPRGES